MDAKSKMFASQPDPEEWEEEAAEWEEEKNEWEEEEQEKMEEFSPESLEERADAFLADLDTDQSGDVTNKEFKKFVNALFTNMSKEFKEGMKEGHKELKKAMK